jgi:hypothetical protein
LIIITDGCCHDMPASRKALVDLSGMPVSVVIIGVGDDDFE